MANNTRFVAAQIDEEQHRLLCRLATMLGKHPADLLSIAVQRFLTEVTVENPPLDLQVFQALMKVRRNTDIEAMLRDMAIAYQNNPSEESADILNRMLELCGYTLEDVDHWIQQDRLVPLSRGGSPLTDQAITFMAGYMQVGNEYPMTDITDKARELGISAAALGVAKRKLNVRSVRRSTCWVWVRDQ